MLTCPESAHISKQVTWLVVTEVRSASSGLVLHAQHIFANSVNFCITWRLLVTIFHSTCIFCTYGMALYWPTLQFYVCVYVSFVCRYMAPPGEWYYNTLLCCDNFSSSNVVSHSFPAVCVYSKFGHRRHTLGNLCAKFNFFCGLHCWARPPKKNRVHNHSITPSAYLLHGEPMLALQN